MKRYTMQKDHIGQGSIKTFKKQKDKCQKITQFRGQMAEINAAQRSFLA